MIIFFIFLFSIAALPVTFTLIIGKKRFIWIGAGLSILIFLIGVGYQVYVNFNKVSEDIQRTKIALDSRIPQEKLLALTDARYVRDLPKNKTWLNLPNNFEREIVLSDLVERDDYVVLINYWNTESGDSLSDLQKLNYLYQKYKSENFLIIGVHLPKNNYQNLPQNISEMVDKLGIDFPVMVDNLPVGIVNKKPIPVPTQVLVDKGGRVRYYNFGSGEYVYLDILINNLLAEEKRYKLSTDIEYFELPIPSEQLYLNNENLDRGRFINFEQIPFNFTTNFQPVSESSLINDYAALEGEWTVLEDQITGKFGSKIHLSYTGKGVKIISGDTPIARIIVSQDGSTPKQFTLEANQVYTIIENEEYGEHVLSIESESQEAKLRTIIFN